MYKPDNPAVRKAVRQILQAIYYRHEFARRREDIGGESRELLQLFFGSLNLGGSFIVPKTGALLTDYLIGAFPEAKVARSREMRDTLREFLRERQVLPMLMSNESFFPNTNETDEKQLWKIWKGLVRFEFFALAKLKVGRSFLFPVMYVGAVEVPEEVKLYNRLELDNESYPLLINFQVPNDVLLNYFRAFGAFTIESSRELKELARSKKNFERRWQRLREEPLDAVLEAHDLDLSPPGAIEEKERRMREIYRQRFSDPNPDASMRTINNVFDDWLKRAEQLKKNYKFII